jgi:hypothetical protein
MAALWCHLAHPSGSSRSAAGYSDGPYEVRRSARDLVRAGANVFKVATTGQDSSPLRDT